MTARVIRFQPRRSSAVWVLREGAAWLVVANDHGWLHGSRASAVEDAQWLSENLNLPIRSAAQ